MATLTTFDSYIDMDENAIEYSFQYFKVVNATFVGIGKKISTPQLSKVTKSGIKQIVGKEARDGYGLRKFLQESLKAVLVIMKHDRYGLGYKPDAKSHNKIVKLEREKRIASLMGALVEREHMVFPHIHEAFYSAEMQHNDIKPSGASSLKEFEKLSISAIKGIDVKEEDIPIVLHLSQ